MESCINGSNTFILQGAQIKTHILAIIFLIKMLNLKCFHFFKVDNDVSESLNQNVKIRNFLTNQDLIIQLSGDFIRTHILCGDSISIFTKHIEFTEVKTRKLYEIEFFKRSIASQICLFK